MFLFRQHTMSLFAIQNTRARTFTGTNRKITSTLFAPASLYHRFSKDLKTVPKPIHTHEPHSNEKTPFYTSNSVYRSPGALSYTRKMFYTDEYKMKTNLGVFGVTRLPT